MSRVWIRGIGAICSAGNGMPEIVAAARAEVSTFATPAYTPAIPAEALVAEAKFPVLQPTRSQLMIKAALEEAMKDSRLPEQAWACAGIFVGTTSGFSQLAVDNAHLITGDETAPRLSSSGIVAETVAEMIGASGPQYTFTSACTSSCIAALEAWRMIRDGDLDTAIVVGFESLLNLTFQGFNTMMLFDENGCRPFDKNRAGMTIGEGVGILILSKEAPREDNSEVSCEVLSVSALTEHGSLAGQPQNGSSGEILWKKLGVKGNFLPSDVTAVKVHGTGTADNDSAEAATIRKFFPRPEDRPPLVGLKGLTGHALGAAAGIEIALWTGFMRAGFLPKSIGFEEADPDLGVSLSRTLLPAPNGIHVLQFFGFGGSSAAIALRYHPAVVA